MSTTSTREGMDLDHETPRKRETKDFFPALESRPTEEQVQQRIDTRGVLFALHREEAIHRPQNRGESTGEPMRPVSEAQALLESPEFKGLKTYLTERLAAEFAVMTRRDHRVPSRVRRLPTGERALILELMTDLSTPFLADMARAWQETPGSELPRIVRREVDETIKRMTTTWLDQAEHAPSGPVELIKTVLERENQGPGVSLERMAEHFLPTREWQMRLPHQDTLKYREIELPIERWQQLEDVYRWLAPMVMKIRGYYGKSLFENTAERSDWNYLGSTGIINGQDPLFLDAFEEGQELRQGDQERLRKLNALIDSAEDELQVLAKKLTLVQKDFAEEKREEEKLEKALSPWRDLVRRYQESTVLDGDRAYGFSERNEVLDHDDFHKAGALIRDLRDRTKTADQIRDAGRFHHLRNAEEWRANSERRLTTFLEEQHQKEGFIGKMDAASDLELKLKISKAKLVRLNETEEHLKHARKDLREKTDVVRRRLMDNPVAWREEKK